MSSSAMSHVSPVPLVAIQYTTNGRDMLVNVASTVRQTLPWLPKRQLHFTAQSNKLEPWA